jgi:hypothetical protein
MKQKSILHLFLLIVLFKCIAPSPVRAYLDPGTGSYLFQLLIAGLLGSTFFLKSIITRLKSLFKNRESSTEGVEGEED